MEIEYKVELVRDSAYDGTIVEDGGTFSALGDAIDAAHAATLEEADVIFYKQYARIMVEGWHK
jgi:hypothetical protein